MATPVCAKELWERKWIEVRSPHFVIASAISQERTVALAQELEHFRTMAAVITSIGRFDERIPTHLYVLPHRVAALGFKGRIAGFFRAEMRANYAAVAPVSGADLAEILKHGYIHFLVHNRDSLEYPAWFDEGFAEVLQTLAVRGLEIEYGKPRAPIGSQVSHGCLSRDYWRHARRPT